MILLLDNYDSFTYNIAQALGALGQEVSVVRSDVLDAEAFGAKVVRSGRPVHGKTSAILHDGRTIFAGLRNPFTAARYHSLVVPEETVKPPLEVSAYTADGEVMGLRAAGLGVEGVQFHPESIATPQGTAMFRNFLGHYLGCRLAA